MGTEVLQRRFAAIGARLNVVGRQVGAPRIDVGSDALGLFDIRFAGSGRRVELEVVDIDRADRHLLLLVRDGEEKSKFLCGHDERHWFVASLPFARRTVTVRGAMEALKPAIVLREQDRKGVRHRRYRRKTAAYVRQGEWFFLPRPMMHVGALATRNGQLVRPGGKPHHVEWLYRPEGGSETFVRGAVSHPDHATIYLQVWHRVVQNAEAEPAPIARPVTRMAYLD
jgi:hypothetical protein